MLISSETKLIESLIELQEVFHVYLNKFEIAVSHIFRRTEAVFHLNNRLNAPLNLKMLILFCPFGHTTDASVI